MTSHLSDGMGEMIAPLNRSDLVILSRLMHTTGLSERSWFWFELLPATSIRVNWLNFL